MEQFHLTFNKLTDDFFSFLIDQLFSHSSEQHFITFFTNFSVTNLSEFQGKLLLLGAEQENNRSRCSFETRGRFIARKRF